MWTTCLRKGEGFRLPRRGTHARVDPMSSTAPLLLAQATIAGVRTWPLTMHRDQRGHLTEVFRAEWDTGLAPVQWTVLLNEEGLMRGMDIHVWHNDWQVLLEGHAALGLKDLRRGSP